MKNKFFDKFKSLNLFGIEKRKKEQLNMGLKSLVIQGDLEKIQKKVNEGADIHFANDLMLRYAVMYNQVKIVQYCIDNGANIHLFNNVALLESIKNGYTDIVKCLIENGAEFNKNELIEEAISEGYIDIINLLKNKGLDLHKNEDALLVYAVQCNQAKVVSYLIENNANIKSRGNEAIIHSLKKGYIKIIEHLLNAGIDIDYFKKYATHELSKEWFKQREEQIITIKKEANSEENIAQQVEVINSEEQLKKKISI